MTSISTQHNAYSDVLDAISSATPGGRNIAGLRLGKVTDSIDPRLNASVVVSLDKIGYAHFLGRDMNYLHIPLSGQMVMNEIRDVIVDIIQETFINQEEPSGRPWEPLKKSTERWRRSVTDTKPAYPIGPPLIASGDLMRAVMRWPKDSSEYRTNRATVGANARLVISIDEIDPSQQQKAYVHNIGGPWGWHGSDIPARPFMPTDTNDFNGADRQRIKSAARRGFDRYASYFDHPERIRRPR